MNSVGNEKDPQGLVKGLIEEPTGVASKHLLEIAALS